MSESKRKDFKKWQVDLVYELQDGCCLGCGTSLEHGFHRHHKDGDHSNNKTDNLELYCPECHHARKGEAAKTAWTSHKERESKALKDLDKLISQALGEGKLSGATAERILEAISKGLSVSRRGLDRPESVPASILIERKYKQREVQLESYIEGIKEGIRLGAEVKK